MADLLPKAAEARAVAATLCNERSSRSHSLFRLKISGQNSKTGEECEGESAMWGGCTLGGVSVTVKIELQRVMLCEGVGVSGRGKAHVCYANQWQKIHTDVLMSSSALWVW